MNFYNLLLAGFRFFLVFIEKDQYNLNMDIHDIFFEGAFYFTIHLSLLVNPYITTNILMASSIFIIQLATAWVTGH